MIRTLLKPESQNISIRLPRELVGKLIEVIAFSVDEAKYKFAIDVIQTHYASQNILAKDWLTPEEDLVWKDL